LLDKKIKSTKELIQGGEYWIDNDYYVLISKEPNRYIFSTLCGTYVVNDAMIAKHIKEGIFSIKSVAC